MAMERLAFISKLQLALVQRRVTKGAKVFTKRMSALQAFELEKAVRNTCRRQEASANKFFPRYLETIQGKTTALNPVFNAPVCSPRNIERVINGNRTPKSQEIWLANEVFHNG